MTRQGLVAGAVSQTLRRHAPTIAGLPLTVWTAIAPVPIEGFAIKFRLTPAIRLATIVPHTGAVTADELILILVAIAFAAIFHADAALLELGITHPVSAGVTDRARGPDVRAQGRLTLRAQVTLPIPHHVTTSGV